VLSSRAIERNGAGRGLTPPDATDGQIGDGGLFFGGSLLVPPMFPTLHAARKNCPLRLGHFAENPKANTQAVVARKLGVTQQAVSLWWGTNTSACNASRPDARVTVPPKELGRDYDHGQQGHPKEN